MHHRYCFGGIVAVRFGATDLLDSIVVVHPGPVSLEQIRAIKVRRLVELSAPTNAFCLHPQLPAAWVCAEG